MANDANLTPIRSESKARELGRLGGIASGQARREKKHLRQVAAELLQTDLPSGETVQEALLGKLVRAALADDCKPADLMKAIILLCDISGHKQDDKPNVQQLAQPTPSQWAAAEAHVNAYFASRGN